MRGLGHIVTVEQTPHQHGHTCCASVHEEHRHGCQARKLEIIVFDRLWVPHRKEESGQRIFDSVLLNPADILYLHTPAGVQSLKIHVQDSYRYLLCIHVRTELLADAELSSGSMFSCLSVVTHLSSPCLYSAVWSNKPILCVILYDPCVFSSGLSRGACGFVFC
jgi:hypothetical protein